MCKEDKLTINRKSFASQQAIFDAAGLFAVREAQQAGLPITYVLEDSIIKEYPDGTKEYLGKVAPRITVEERIITINA
jgi:hypothetical protein